MPTKTKKKPARSTAKKVEAKKKSKTVYWDMTPAQQKQYKKDLAKARAKARRDIGGPTAYTVLRTTSDGWKICAANHPLDLRITQQCIDNAVCSSKKECVVAQAIHRQVWNASDWMVGSRITIITCEPLKMVIKYGTSKPLAMAIPNFDNSKGKVWDLEPGLYRLNPLPVGYRIGSRFLMLKSEENRIGGKKSVFKGTAKTRTRSGTYVQAIRKKPS
jgi:hypothetical protein